MGGPTLFFSVWGGPAEGRRRFPVLCYTCLCDLELKKSEVKLAASGCLLAFSPGRPGPCAKCQEAAKVMRKAKTPPQMRSSRGPWRPQHEPWFSKLQ